MARAKFIQTEPEILRLPMTRYSKLANIFEYIAFYGLLSIIFLAAIPYGTVDPRFKLSFVFLCSIFVLFRIAEAILKKTPLFTNISLFLPLFGIIALAIFQIIPINFLPQIVNDSSNYQTTISMDVYETKIFILIFFSLMMTGELLLRYTNTNERIWQLIYLVFAISIGSALFGLARLVFPSIENTVLSSFIKDKIQFAQFVNRNHFTYLMEMNLGLLLGLQLKEQIVEWQKPLYWVMTGITCFAIIISNSRGGIMSMVGLIIFIVFLYFMTREKGSRYETDREPPTSWVSNYLGKILIALIFSILFFGMMVFLVAFVGGDPLVSRFETVQNEVNENKDGKIRRREIWQSTIELIKANPIVGVGFGAYPIAITKYDTSSGQFALKQAHNDYLEILANGGLVGFSLVLIFIVVLLKKIGLQIRSINNFRQASCFGAVTGIFGVMLHSFVEFGLHVIINALIFTVLIVIAIAKTDSSTES